MRGTLTVEQRQKQVITRLKNENARLRDENNGFQKIIEEQKQRIEALELRIEELTQIVFSKKKKKKSTGTEDSESKKKDKKKTERSKESYQRATPKDSEVTEEFRHTIDICHDCGNTNLTNLKEAIFYIEDIILPRFEKNENGEETIHNPSKIVEKHVVEKKWCNQCKKWVSAIPIPPTKVLIGKNARLYITYLTILIRNSYEQTIKLFRDTYNFTLTDGEIGNVLEKESDILKVPFEQLKERVTSQKGVHFDETSWDVQSGEQGNFAWVAAGVENDDAVYLLGRSRGKGNAKELIGKENKKNIIGISDDYGAYRNLFKTHQLCWAHPLRKFRDLASSDTLEKEKKKHCQEVYESFSDLYADVRETIESSFREEERKRKAKGYLKRIEKIAKEDKKDPKKLKTLKESLQKNKEKYFPCVLHEGIPADNNKAERALRHLVIKRRVSFGSRTQKGADSLSILFSVLLSLWRRDEGNFFHAYSQVRDTKEMA